MSLDPDDFGLFQDIAVYIKYIKEIQGERLDIEGKMLDIARLNARREFLLLSSSPERVRDQLRSEFEGLSETTADIVAKPE